MGYFEVHDTTIEIKVVRKSPQEDNIITTPIEPGSGYSFNSHFTKKLQCIGNKKIRRIHRHTNLAPIISAKF